MDDIAAWFVLGSSSALLSRAKSSSSALAPCRPSPHLMRASTPRPSASSPKSSTASTVSPPPHGFLSEYYMHRALAYLSAGGSQSPLWIATGPWPAIRPPSRPWRPKPCSWREFGASQIASPPGTLYNTVLRDRKLPEPAWKPHHMHYREIPGKLCALVLEILLKIMIFLIEDHASAN
ncbi:uncharacterized protein J3R85_004059 [Psidium guajava]|nr:uncharacterized protein J3R85_004059 [Psidium guajava]